MRCRLCGDDIESHWIFCSECQRLTHRWARWAAEQYDATARWPKVEVTFSTSGAVIKVDSSGGAPDPNRFVPSPARALPPSDWVHVRVPLNSAASHDGQSLASQSTADVAFYLRIKNTPGCMSKQDSTGNVMNLYIRPNSEAAKLFVSRLRPKLPESREMRTKLLPGQKELPEPQEMRAKLLTGLRIETGEENA